MSKTSLVTFAHILDIDFSAALEKAIELGFVVHQYASPTSPAVAGLTADEAMDVAREDVGLIWIETD